MKRGEISIFATFGGHLGFLWKTVRDRAISSKFLTRRVVQESPVQRGEISIFATFGGHLGFLWKTVRDRAISSKFLTNRVDFCGKWKRVNISKTVRDGAISSEFLTQRVVQESPVKRGEISIFATFGGHLGFLRKMEKGQYLENRKR